MRRSSKTFSEPFLPKSNKFTLDLAGLDLDDDNLARVRSAAVRAAMREAGAILNKVGGGALDGFGTFSTFSTFSTFGSGADVGRLPAGIDQVINRAVGGAAG